MSSFGSRGPGGLLSGRIAGLRWTTGRTLVFVGFAVGVIWLSTASAAPASGWSILPTPVPAHSGDAALAGVSCTSSTNCTAVGYWTPLATPDVVLPLAEQWNGSIWRLERVPVTADVRFNGGQFLGVSCTSSAACMAVGSGGSGGLPLVERWDGSRWSITPAPNLGLENQLDGVSCASSTACVAVGDESGASIAERWDGRRWSLQNVHYTGERANELTAVSCVAGDNCAAVGDDDVGLCANNYTSDYLVPVLGFWQLGHWSLKRKPDIGCSVNGRNRGGDELLGVSCASSSACTAVGTVVYRWNGRRWSRQSTYDGFEAVSCSSTVFCTAVGLGTAGRWNGSGWSIQNTPQLREGDLSGVSCRPDGACVAVGSYQNRAGTLLPVAETTIGPAPGLG